MNIREGYGQVGEFYDTIASDERISVYHISLYLSLIQISAMAGFQNPVSIGRMRVLKLSRMSRRKFNRCMKELVEFGYLRYELSTDPAVGSKVYFKKL